MNEDEGCEALNYWQCGGLWRTFLTNINYDHAHFIDIFAAVFSDFDCRKSIITKLLRGSTAQYVFNNHPKHFLSIQDIFEDIENTWFEARRAEKRAVIIFKYPAVRDYSAKDSPYVSHDVLLVADPVLKSVLYIDSRGVEYAQNAFRSWKRSYESLQHLFAGCDWIHYNYFDIQALYSYDNFCQTWSLVLLRDALAAGKSPPPHSLPWKADFDTIASFWKEMYNALEDVRDKAFEEIYAQTHSAAGERVYNQYFTTLEALVTGSNGRGYPRHTRYAATGYTFIEDFLGVLNGRLLHKVLDVAPKLPLLALLRRQPRGNSFLAVLNALSPSQEDYFVDLGELFGIESAPVQAVAEGVGLQREVPPDCLYFSLDPDPDD